MINRRQMLTGTAAVLAASTLPAIANEPFVLPFEPLYTRLTTAEGSALYSSPSAIRRIENGKTLFFGVSIGYPRGIRFCTWQEYPIEKVSMSGLLMSGNQELLEKNEKHYMEHGFTVAEMPQDMRKIHNRWLAVGVTEPHWIG